jgi:hypothetical protein
MVAGLYSKKAAGGQEVAGTILEKLWNLVKDFLSATFVRSSYSICWNVA